MLIDILFIVLGIYIVLKGADFLTDGAVSLAQRMDMPEMIIGLTVVALGTSMPEFFVSVTSALQGTTDLAVANVVGSNIFNVLLIGGCVSDDYLTIHGTQGYSRSCRSFARAPTFRSNGRDKPMDGIILHSPAGIVCLFFCPNSFAGRQYGS